MKASFFTLIFLSQLSVSAQELLTPFDAFVPMGASLSEKVARSVDHFGAPNAAEAKLLRVRTMNTRTVDPTFLLGSQIQKETGNTFFSSIRQAVDLSLKARKIFSNPDIDAAYGLPGQDKSLEVSLISHSLCAQDTASLSHILGADYVPDANTQKRINNFTNLHNAHRARAMKGEADAKEKIALIWSTFFSCLGYAESLSDPDSSPEGNAAYADFLSSNAAIASDFAQRGLSTRSPGVHFGIDHPGEYYIRRRAIKADTSLTEAQRAAALKALDEEYNQWGPKKWVVAGLFQFLPETTGNVIPCVNQWNQSVSEFGRPRDFEIGINKVELSRAIVSPLQNFNAYCGVQKVVQGFNSQTNTINATGVHPANILPTQKLKAPQDRCMSLPMRGGRGRMYTHFGPLRNSTQKNMASLFQCVDASMIEDIKR